MKTNPGLIGDVYVAICESRDHHIARMLGDKGAVFARRYKDVDFPDDIPATDDICCRNLTMNCGEDASYFDIVEDTSLSHQPAAPSAIFIPRGARKSAVATDLRRRLGSGAMLLKPSHSAVETTA